jgi:hypothetical protein
LSVKARSAASSSASSISSPGPVARTLQPDLVGRVRVVDLERDAAVPRVSPSTPYGAVRKTIEAPSTT